MYRRFIKYALDFFFALFLIVLLAPLLIMLCFTGVIFLKGNPFFVQTRIGKDERPFYMVKFRTMTADCDASGMLLPDDQRTTSYGRLLRKSSLDELPELFNVLKGDMSFIGPRPLLCEYLPFYSETERLRHSVRPGITGLAQINGRTNIRSWDERFDFDLQYVKRCSFWLDCCIFGKTIVNVIRKKDVLIGGEITAGRLDQIRGGGIHAGCDQRIP